MLGALAIGLPATAACAGAKAALYFSETDYFQQSPGCPGGVLQTSASYEPGSFDIHKLLAGNMIWQGRLVYDSLVYLDAAGSPTPWLARSWWQSPDRRVYRFHLRRDVTFSDGTSFNAAAVQINFERIKALGPKSHISNAYLGSYSEGRIVDEFTFEARFATPYPSFLQFLAQTWMGFISPQQIQHDPGSIAAQPVGTGPFVVADYNPGKQIVFKRRPDYNWSPAYIGHSGAAYLDEVILDVIPDDTARADRLLTGRHGLTFEAPAASAAAFRADNGFVFSNRVRQGSPMRSLSFNPARFPFSDVRIRSAAALAIDREAITRQLSAGEFLPKNDYLGTNTPGYDGAFRNVLAYDPVKANALLDAAGWQQRGADGIRTQDGRRLSAVLATTGSERTPPASVVMMQSDLRKAGLELNLQAVAPAGLPKLIQSGDYDALTGGWWSANSPDVLFLLYHSSQFRRQAALGQNTAALADPKLDALLLRAWQTIDRQERAAVYDEVQGLLTALVPVVPLHESHHLSAHSKDIKGIIFDTVHNTPLLTAAWLQPVAA